MKSNVIARENERDAAILEKKPGFFEKPGFFCV
jgi:hypothetical protein